jgi:hypothetical protein
MDGTKQEMKSLLRYTECHERKVKLLRDLIIRRDEWGGRRK